MSVTPKQENPMYTKDSWSVKWHDTIPIDAFQIGLGSTSTENRPLGWAMAKTRSKQPPNRILTAPWTPIGADTPNEWAFRQQIIRFAHPKQASAIPMG